MRILAVDFSHLWHRNWHASGGRELSETFSRTVNAVASARDGFDRVALCCDGGRSFRTLIESQYKADREKQPAPFYEQMDRTKARLVADGCAVFEPTEVRFKGQSDDVEPVYAEADDVIASLVAWCIAHEHTCRILGSDKDLLQLIDDERGIDVLRPDIAPDLWTETECRTLLVSVKEAGKAVRLGLPPSQIADALALGLDTSDGYRAFPGWIDIVDGKESRRPGIGGPTAVRLIQRFGSIAGVVAALDLFEADGTTPQIKGHVAEVLRRGQPTPTDAATRGLRLATVRRDLAIDFSILEAEPVVSSVAGGELDADQEAGAPEVQAEPVATPPARSNAPPAGAAPIATAPEQSAALAVRPHGAALDVYELEPRASNLAAMCARLFDARVYPQFPNANAIMACIVDARALGVPVGAALRGAYVVKNRLAWSAAFMAALVLASPVCNAFEIVETTTTKAVLEYQRKGSKRRSFEVTIEEARAAGWLRPDSKWLTNPRTMLRWFAMREAARAFFPDVVSGMYTPDELRGHATDDEIGGGE